MSECAGDGVCVCVCPTCDLGFDLALHLQRVHEDAAVADEAGAGDASVGLAEPLLLKILPGTDTGENQHGEIGQVVGHVLQCTELPLEASTRHV